MPKDVYVQRDAPDPVLAEAVVLVLVRHHVPGAQAVRATPERRRLPLSRSYSFMITAASRAGS